MQPSTTVLQEHKVYLVRQVKDEGKEMDRGQDTDDMVRVIDRIENH